MRSPPRHVLRTVLAATLALAGVACASSGTAPIEGANGTIPATVRVDGGRSTFQTNITHDDRAAESEVPATADRVFAVLSRVYEQVGLKVNTAVSDSRTIGVSAARTRRVGKEPLSRYLSCGTDVTGTSLADSYSVTLTVLSRVTPAGPAASLLSTRVSATAAPMATSGNPVTCESTGALESLIARTAVVRAAS